MNVPRIESVRILAIAGQRNGDHTRATWASHPSQILRLHTNRRSKARIGKAPISGVPFRGIPKKTVERNVSVVPIQRRKVGVLSQLQGRRSERRCNAAAQPSTIRRAVSRNF